MTAALVLAVLACLTAGGVLAFVLPWSRLLAAGLLVSVATLTFGLAVQIATRPLSGPPWELVVFWPVFVAVSWVPWCLLWLLAGALRRHGWVLPARLVLGAGAVLYALWLYAGLVGPVEELTGRCLPPAENVAGGCDLPPG